METVEIPQAELKLDEDTEAQEEEDLYKHSQQRISSKGRIQVSKRAWLIRGVMLGGLIIFMIYNLSVALSVGDPLIVYSTLMPIHALTVLVTGWVFFKNKANGKYPDDLVSVIIPVYNQENLIEKVVRRNICLYLP